MSFNYQSLTQSFENVIYLRIIKYDYLLNDFLILVILFKFFKKLAVVVASKTKYSTFISNKKGLKMFKTNYDD